MRPQASTRRWLLPMLAAALLWLQALGLWHLVVHGHAAPGGAALAFASGHDPHDHHEDHERHAFAGHDEGDPQCRLFDQLAHADIAFSLPAALPARAAQGRPASATPAGRLASQAAGFLARGPPVAA